MERSDSEKTFPDYYRLQTWNNTSPMASCWAFDHADNQYDKDGERSVNREQEREAVEMFQYSPLPQEFSCIRILILKPATSFTDPIRCSLKWRALAWKPLYQALSYAWGDPRPTKTISLDQKWFGIAENLECALRHLRLKDQERILWVDAVCINQMDLKERAEQIQIMPDIYRLSVKIVIWLGKDLNDEQRTKYMSSFEIFTCLDKLATSEDARDLLQDVEPKKWRSSILNFIQKPWFTRLWVIQELTMGFISEDPNDMSPSPDSEKHVPLLTCGHYSQHWPVFLFAMLRIGPTLNFYNSSGEVIQSVFEPVMFLIDCYLYYSRFSLTGKWQNPVLEDRLAQLLFSCSGRFNAADRRDRLYAILGLLGDPEKMKKEPTLVPDYRKSDSKVLTDLAKYLIMQRKNLDILCGYGFDSHVEGMPTWVPNWGRITTRTIHRYLPALGENFKAPDHLAEFEFSENDTVLSVKGVVVGMISAVGHETDFDIDWTTEGSRSKLLKLLSGWENDILNSDVAQQKGITEKEVRKHLKSVLFHSSDETKATTERFYYDYLLGHVTSGDIRNFTECSETIQCEVDVFARFKQFHFSDKLPFITSQGDIGLTEATLGISMDDTVCLLLGCPVPVLIRKVFAHYIFLGVCVIPKFMEKEAQTAVFEAGALEVFNLR